MTRQRSWQRWSWRSGAVVLLAAASVTAGCAKVTCSQGIPAFAFDGRVEAIRGDVVETVVVAGADTRGVEEGKQIEVFYEDSNAGRLEVGRTYRIDGTSASPPFVSRLAVEGQCGGGTRHLDDTPIATS